MTTRTALVFALAFTLSACTNLEYFGQREYLLVKTQTQDDTPSQNLQFRRAAVTNFPGSSLLSNCALASSNAAGCSIESPAWSPDGARFAVISRELKSGEFEPSPWELFVVEFDGNSTGAFTRIETGPDKPANPSWSPDGRYLVYGIAGDVFVSDICTPTDMPSQITTDPSRDSDPTWSRDGEWIAFVSERGGNDDIWAIELTRRLNMGSGTDFILGTPQNWTNTPQIDERIPAFSKIGPSPSASRGINQIVFDRDDDLWTLPVPPNNAAPSQLTTDGREKQYAEFVLNNLAVAFNEPTREFVQSPIREVNTITGRSQIAPESTSLQYFSSRQTYSGPTDVCP